VDTPDDYEGLARAAIVPGAGSSPEGGVAGGEGPGRH